MTKNSGCSKEEKDSSCTNQEEEDHSRQEQKNKTRSISIDIPPLKIDVKESWNHSISLWLQHLLRGSKYLFSSALLAFCILILMTAISSGKLIPGLGGMILFWILIIYLGIIEGGQNALVGLQPLDPQIYQSATHSFTLRAINLTTQSKGALQQFLMGRQLITVIVIFALNGVGGIHEGCTTLFQLPSPLSALFCSSGLAIILVTILLGQVTTQILSTRYMIDFINNIFFLFTVYLSVAIECSGILHMVHFVSDTISYFTRPASAPAPTAVSSNASESHQSPTRLEGILYWSRVLISFLCLGFSLGCIIQEIRYGHTTMWSGVPPFVSILLFFFLLLSVGILEGLQIALFAATNMNLVLHNDNSTSLSPSNHPSSLQFDEIPSPLPLTPSKSSPATLSASTSTAPNSLSNCASSQILSNVKKNCSIVFHRKNFSSFVVGRQICVTVLTFVLARISTIDPNHTDFSSHDYTTFGVSSGFQNFINTGIVGAFVTTLLGSLVFRVIASRYPLDYLANPLVAPVLCLCMALESTGVMQCANGLARFLRICLRFKSDELYKAEYQCRKQQRQGEGDAEDRLEDMEEGVVEFRI